MQTPAITARQDMRDFRDRDNSRYLRIRERTKEIQDEKVIAENLIELYQTDPETALNRFNEIRVEAKSQATSENPPVALTSDEQKTKQRAMSMRGKVENWRSQVSEDFDEQLAESITEIQTAIQQGNELITWFRKCIPTIAEYTGEEGKTSFTDDDVITETTDDGAVISQRIDQHYFSIVNLFNGFITRWQNTINDYQDEIDLYNDNPLGDLISAVEGLGLEQTFEDSNDGYLWFTDPETHQIYFISVYNKVAAIGGQVHVLDNFGYKRNIDDLNWKSNWHVDLVHTAIIWYPGSIRPFHSVASDYFGAYDSLRRWIAASIEKGNTPPEFYPSHLVTSTGTANPNV